MPLLLHDTFSGSGNLDTITPDTIGTAWTLQEVWSDTSTANANFYFSNGSGRSRIVVGSGVASMTTSMAGSYGGPFYKAGCTVPNDFDLEFQASAIAPTNCRFWVIWRATLNGFSPNGKTNGWGGIYSRGGETYWRTYDGVSAFDETIQLTTHAQANNDIIKIEVRGSVVTPYINTVVQTARTYGSMPSSGSVYIGWGHLFSGATPTLAGGENSAGGTINYIKIADPGDLNYVATTYRSRMVNGIL